MKCIPLSFLFICSLIFFIFHVDAADRGLEDPYYSPRPGEKFDASQFEVPQNDPMESSYPPPKTPRSYAVPAKTPRSREGTPREGTPRGATPRGASSGEASSREGSPRPGTPRAVPRTPRGSDINPFVELEGEYVEKRISPRPLRTSNTNPFITASADTEKRVSPRDLIRGRQRSGSTTDLRSPRVDLARRQLQASLQHRKSGSSFPAFSSSSEMQDDFSGPLLDDVATDEVSDDETGEPLEAPKVLIKRSGSGRVPSLRLNKPKEQVSPRMVRHKDAKEPLPESVTAKSLLFRNLSFGFPITDKKNWDSVHKRYFDLPVLDGEGKPLYEVNFPQEQPKTLKNQLGVEHDKWLERTKAVISTYDRARREKKKRKKEYKQVCAEVQGVFNNPAVSIEALLKIEALLSEAKEAFEQSLEAYNREKNQAETALERQGVSLESALKVKELLVKGVEAETRRRALDAASKAQKACEKERFYLDSLSLFHRKLNEAVSLILNTECYKRNSSQAVEYISTSHTQSLVKLESASRDNVPIVGKLAIIENPTDMEMKELFEGVMRFSNFIHLNAEDEATVIVDATKALISLRDSLALARNDAEASKKKAKVCVPPEDSDLNLTDYYAAKSEQAWAIFPHEYGSLKEILQIYNILFPQEGVYYNPLKVVIDQIAEKRRQAESAQENFRSTQWFSDRLLECDLKAPLFEIERAIELLSNPSGLFSEKMKALHQIGRVADEALKGFEAIENSCLIQHAVRGKISKNGKETIEFVSEDRERRYELSHQEFIERSLHLFEEHELEQLITGDIAILKMTRRELKDYTYELSRLLETNMARPYRKRTEQLVGEDRYVAFSETDPVVIRSEIHKLVNWLHPHLKRESDIFQKIITVYWGEYEKLVTGWLSYSSWKNYLSGDPFIDLQRKKLIDKFPSDTVRVPRKAEFESDEEEVQNLFIRTRYGGQHRLERESAFESEEEYQSDDELNLEQERALDERYKHLHGVTSDLPFSWIYDGSDECVETVRTKNYTRTWAYQNGKKHNLLCKREFSWPLETVFVQPIKRLINPAPKTDEDNSVRLFSVMKGLEMAEDYRPYRVLRTHRVRAFDVFSELIERQKKRLTGERKLKDWFQEWTLNKQIVGLETNADQLRYFGKISEEYDVQLALQTKLLNIIKGSPPTSLEHLRRRWTWVRRPLDFFFVEEPELKPPFPCMESLNLSGLGIRDQDLGRLRLVEDETDPQLFRYAWLLGEYPCINLSDNELESPSPDLFDNFRYTLRRIDVSNNELITADSNSEFSALDWMVHLEALEEADISHNPNILTLAAFGINGDDALPYLSVFKLANIGIKNMDPLGGFTNLRVLDLSDNHLELVHAEGERLYAAEMKPRPLCHCLSALIHLEVLGLRNCNLRGHINLILPQLSALKDLNVDENPELKLFADSLSKGTFEFNRLSA